MKREDLLPEVLKWTKAPALFEPAKDKPYPWVKAIVETVKADGSESYAVAYTIDGDKFRIVKDFGSLSPIVKYGKIYPYYYMHERFIPSAKNRDDIINYIISVHGEDQSERIRNLGSEELKKLIYANAARLSIASHIESQEYYAEKEKYLSACQEELDNMKESKEKEYLDQKNKLEEYQKKAAEDEKKERTTTRGRKSKQGNI